jgi:electron transfer flavoprotein beta subunit
MEIIVLVKQVPDTTEVRLDPRTGNLIREGVESIMNPDDRHALEAAARLKETCGGRVTVISMGPSQAIDVITEAMGICADRGILLCDRAFAGADTWATSTTLGKAVRKLGGFDVVLCGRQAIDGDTAQIGPQVAEYLDIAHISCVTAIEEVKRKSVTVSRRTEDGFERIRSSLPVLLNVVKEMNEPRYPAIASLLAACGEKAPIEVWNAADLGVQVGEVGIQGSLTQVIRTFAPKSKRQTEMIEGDTSSVVESLISRLREKKLIR